jgi:hypothetical protein
LITTSHAQRREPADVSDRSTSDDLEADSFPIFDLFDNPSAARNNIDVMNLHRVYYPDLADVDAKLVLTLASGIALFEKGTAKGVFLPARERGAYLAREDFVARVYLHQVLYFDRFTPRQEPHRVQNIAIDRVVVALLAVDLFAVTFFSVVFLAVVFFAVVFFAVVFFAVVFFAVVLRAAGFAVALFAVVLVPFLLAGMVASLVTFTLGATCLGDHRRHGDAQSATVISAAEAACSLNKNAANDAEDPRVAAGTMTPGGATVPWITWDENVGPGNTGPTQIFVARLVNAGANFEVANNGAPISITSKPSTRPDITFSGNTPYVSWRENTGGAVDKVFTGHFTDPNTFVLDSGGGVDITNQTAGDVREPISSGCTADPFSHDGAACQGSAVGTPFFLFVHIIDPHQPWPALGSTAPELRRSTCQPIAAAPCCHVVRPSGTSCSPTSPMASHST